MAHTIELFSDASQASRETRTMVEVGKCASCVLIERHPGDAETERKAAAYGVSRTPTIVIDGRIKVEGKPDFAWMCGDDFYAWLSERYPLRRARNPHKR